MKTVHIVGLGVSGPTTQVLDIIKSCDVLLGARRQIEAFSHLGKPSYPEYGADAVRRIIETTDAGRFAVLVSGDVGFYSGARALVCELSEYDVRLAAGVPSVCDFFAKLKLPWQDAALVSMHGTGAPIVDAARRNRLTFCLTGNNTREIGAMLTRAGLGGLTVYVGEDLGCPQERITELKAEELSDTRPLTSLVIVNEDFDASAPHGLPDASFDRLAGIPMTKSEVRAVVLSKLMLSPGFVCYDVGAGTGSVAVEMALSAYGGYVFAVERNENAIALIEGNCRKRHVGNVAVIRGNAPGALEALPVPDAVFIGGSGGQMAAITDAVIYKNPKARIVATAIAPETVSAALAAFERAGVSDTELVQLNVSHAVKRGGLHMMTAQNPIFIISGGGK